MIDITKQQTKNRIYYQKFRDRLITYSREYFSKLSNERIDCRCGKNIYLRNQKRHETSLRHRKYEYLNNKTKEYV